MKAAALAFGKAAAWWLPAWALLAAAQSLRFDSAHAHWLQLWLYSIGYLALPFWAGWWLSNMSLTPLSPRWKTFWAVAATVAWMAVDFFHG